MYQNDDENEDGDEIPPSAALANVELAKTILREFYDISNIYISNKV